MPKKLDPRRSPGTFIAVIALIAALGGRLSPPAA
jgi:hypothetical protein